MKDKLVMLLNRFRKFGGNKKMSQGTVGYLGVRGIVCKNNLKGISSL